MKLILCVDENDGLLFHRRRQSQDRAVRADLLAGLNGGALVVSPYTARQFTEPTDVLRVCDTPLLTADDAWCFAEEPISDAVFARVTELVLYRWHRRYPSDTAFTQPYRTWTQTECRDFAGFSHDVITKEVYCR